MPSPVLPNVIQGPAIITHNGYTYFVQNSVELRLVRQSFDLQSAYGRLDTRHISQRYEISFTPVGEIEQAAFDAMFEPTLANNIGSSIFPANEANALLTIYSRAEGKTYKFPRAGILTRPSLGLAPNRPLFDAITFVAIVKASTLPTVDNSIKSYGTETTGFTDFDDTLCYTDIYKATWNGVTYSAQDGFRLAVGTETQEINTDLGIYDIILRSIDVTCEFAPVGSDPVSQTTQQVIDQILGIQGSAALLPGESYARLEQSLVLQSVFSGHLKVTLQNMGPKEIDHSFEIGTHQHRRLAFTCRRNFSGSTPTPLWVFQDTGAA